MAITQNPVNFNEWVNISEGIELLPAKRRLMNALGLFESKVHMSKDVFIPITEMADYKLVDTPYNVRMQTAARDAKKRLRLEIPHFGETDSILPADISGKYDWEDFLAPTRVATVEAEVNRKKLKHVGAIERTKDDAMLKLIVDGDVYAPNGTVINNIYAAMGVSRTESTISLAPDAVLRTEIQAEIDGIVDTFQGGFVPTRFVRLCGRDHFDAIATHPYTIDVAKAVVNDTAVEILQGKLSLAVGEGTSNRDTYQTIEMFGVVFIRMSPAEMPVDEARMFPVDVPDMFQIHYAPSQLTFDTVNSPAQEVYYFEKAEADRTAINFVYESNFACTSLWPKAIIKSTATYA